MAIDLADLNFKKAPKIVTEIPGPKTKALLEKIMDIDSNVVSYPKVVPMALEEGKGTTIKDVDGNVYIDLFAGIGVLNFGYSNPFILRYVKDQLDKISHCLDFSTPIRFELLEKLNETAPSGLKDDCKIFLSAPTGADAVTAAIRLAKFVTKRNTILAFWGGYHGSVGEAGGVTSWKISAKCNNLPMPPDMHFVPYPNCYRCAFGKDYPDCSLECYEFLRETLENEFSGVCLPAAIVIEAVQGEGGIHVAPAEYMQKLRRLATEMGILLIVDEVQSGMARTGKMWGCEHSGVTPDIMTSAKSIGGAGVPLAACFIKKEFDIWPPATSIGTFRGNVVGIAGGVGALDFIKETNLLDHVNAMSRLLNEGLNELKREYEVIGDIRQMGLMAAVEFVKDRNTKEPWREFLDDVLMGCLKRGVFVWKAGPYFNVLRMLPPLVITEELMNKSLAIIGEVIRDIAKKKGR